MRPHPQEVRLYTHCAWLSKTMMRNAIHASTSFLVMNQWAHAQRKLQSKTYYLLASLLSLAGCLLCRSKVLSYMAGPTRQTCNRGCQVNRTQKLKIKITGQFAVPFNCSQNIPGFWTFTYFWCFLYLSPPGLWSFLGTIHRSSVIISIKFEINYFSPHHYS